MAEHVLITGGAGFIGSRLAIRLASAGHTVTVLDDLIEQVHGLDPDTTSPLLRSLNGIVTVRRGSVCLAEDISVAIEDVTIVVHMAAETGTGQSMYEIDRYVDTNIGGTAKLLQVLAGRSHAVRRLILASSRSIYGEGAYRTGDGSIVYPGHRDSDDLAAGDFEVHHSSGTVLPVATREDARLHPSSIYGITKQTQEALIATTAPTLGIEFTVLRYQNVYGPGQSLKNPYTGILSIFSNLIRQGRTINVFEDGHESRDFVYVDDVVDATYLACTTPGAANAVLNVGSGVATSVRDVVDLLFRAFDIEVPVVISGNFRDGDIRHNFADTTRARQAIGFEAHVSIAEGIQRFAEWVRTEPIEVDRYAKSLEELARRKLLK